MSSSVTPFEIEKAIKSGKDDEQVLSLIGDKIEILDTSKRSPLFYAVISGRHSLVEKILELGALPSRQDLDGRTPLHFAVLERNVPAARLLLREGAQVDALDEHGNTPLWCAVMQFRNFEEMIKLLCSFGASPDSKNIYGKSPRDLARSQRIGDALAWLERYSPSSD